MSARILQAKGKVLIVGSIYDQINKLEKVIHDYEFIIINGNALHPREGAKERICKINLLFQSKRVIYNNGNYDLMLLKDNNFCDWIKNNPNVVFVQYPQTTFIITNGGVSEGMNRETLMDNLETSFISLVDGKSWHQFYGGGYGYIISNNPLTEDFPTFHHFSAQIGNKYQGAETKVYAQEIDQFGLKQTILL
jgi:hypothetical protein